MGSVIPFLFLGTSLLCYFMALKTLAPGRSQRRLQIEAFLLLATPRLGIFWFLMIKHWSDTMEQSHMPLFIFLLPEVLVMPREVEWSGPMAGIMTVLLMAGSGLVAWGMVAWLKRKPKTSE